jgi:hypothetical protein
VNPERSSSRTATSARSFPDIPRGAVLKVERHADHFRHNTPDAEWLQEIGKREWIAISHDSRIRYKPNELQTVMQYGVALLVVVGKPYWLTTIVAFA